MTGLMKKLDVKHMVKAIILKSKHKKMKEN
jgi:hypothetical protein